MNITEDYCSYEVARLLKENGFEGDINAYYHIWDNGNKVCFVQEFSHSEAPHLYIPTPTHQMAMKWLREKHIVIVILPNDFDVIGECWGWRCNVYNKGVLKQIPYDFPLYEEAVEAALKYTLENLENLM